MSSEWPEFFPKLDCPPSAARRDEITVFRLVSSLPPAASDFLPTCVEHPHRTFATDQHCVSCGVSVFRDMRDAAAMRLKFKPLRDKKIAKGQITPVDGFVLETGRPSHMTWWLQTPAPHASFAEYQDHDGR